MMDKIIKVIQFLAPILLLYPRWAQILFIATTGMLVLSLVVFLCILPIKIVGSKRAEPKIPYQGFHDKFREVVAPITLPETGAVLHIVFGSIGDIAETVPVIPINESFDMLQRGRASVLGAFTSHTVKGDPFFQAIDKQWPINTRPSNAGIGYCSFLPLDSESNKLRGAIFVVTTSNKSTSPIDYGIYRNTPIEGIDTAIKCAIQEAKTKKIESLAFPLLGTGYANIRLTSNAPEVKQLLETAVTLVEIQYLETALREKYSPLRRAYIIVYSNNPHSPYEEALWKAVVKFIGSNEKQRSEQIETTLANAKTVLESKP